MTSVPIETAAPVTLEITQITAPQLIPTSTIKPNPQVYKDAIRTSLRASTVDGVFAAVFGVATGGILLSNFLLELGASPVVFGMLSSIPMLVNLVQPLGAYLSERSSSRFHYSLKTHGIGRLLWLILGFSIIASPWIGVTSEQLVVLTLLVVLFSGLLGGLGTASWLSWLAMIVPRRLRGRYFGIRNSAASLTNLLSVPLAGLAVSHWDGGTLQGYGVLLFVAIAFGVISLGCQYFQIDMNPALQNSSLVKYQQIDESAVTALEGTCELNQFKKAEGRGQRAEGTSQKEIQSPPDLAALNKSSVEVLNPCSLRSQAEDRNQNSLLPSASCPLPFLITSPAKEVTSIWNNYNFFRFLLYFGLWMLAFNISAPFFNFYMLDKLHLDVSCVTLYGSLQAGASMLLIVLWGKLADKIGNRRILMSIGILVALTPLLWMGVSGNSWNIWLWLPLLHIFTGGTLAAIDLCNNNLQLGIAPVKNQSIYFAIASAVAGVSGALGATIGGFIAQFAEQGGLLGLFALSTVCRLVAILPLIFVKEPH